MLIPLGTDRPLRRSTLVNHLLVGANVLVFVAGLIASQLDPAWAEQVRERFLLQPLHLHWWSVLTYAFLHAGLLHLAGNMLFLWVFGPNVEDRFGRLGYLLFYLAGAAAGAGLHIAFETSPVIGASGAISAVTGAYLVLFPKTVIRVFAVLVIIGVVAIPAWIFIAAAFLWDLLGYGSGMDGGTAHLAHIGGAIWGAGVSLGLLWTRALQREPYDLFSLLRQAARRREFREAAIALQTAAQNRAAAAAAPSAQVIEEAARLRAELTAQLSAADAPGAAARYRVLLDRFSAQPALCLLSPRLQLDLANRLYQHGNHTLAAAAYERFAAGYPRDRETPGVKLLLGLIHARHLGRPDDARRLVTEAMPGLGEDDQKDLAASLLEELGAASPSPAPAA